MSLGDQLAAQLITGETVDLDELATRLDSNLGYINDVKTKLGQLGYVFVNEGKARRRCTNPNFKPTMSLKELRTQQNRERRARQLAEKSEAERRREVVRELREKREAEAVALDRNGHTLEGLQQPETLLGTGFDAVGPLATPPSLGSAVQVFAMVLNDDGTLRMGVQNGERRWIVDVIGELAR